MTSLLRSLALTVGVAAAALVAAVTSPAAGAVTFLASGTSSAGNPIAARADFTLSGTTLTLVLSNVSPTPSVFADDVLSSFYFDIVRNNVRPSPAYASASGLVWQVRSDDTDLPINSTPPAMPGGNPTFVVAGGSTPHVPSDLRALKSGDRTWQYKPMNAAASPFLGFGIGTVGNSLFGTNGFNPFVVGPPGPNFIGFGIYKDSLVMPSGKPMDGQYLVRDTATFVFTSPALAKFTVDDIAPHAVFGFGTGPDTILTVPEPTGLAGLAGAAAVAAAWGLRRRRPGVGDGRRRGLRPAAASQATPEPAALTRAMVAGGLAACGIFVAGTAAAAPPPVPVVTWNFATGPEGWESQNLNSSGNSFAPNAWAWQNPGGFWRVEPQSVWPGTWLANYLTSPLITVPEATDLLAVTMRHRFQLPVTLATPVQPIVLGQAVYRVFDMAPANPFNDPTPFLPLPASAWIDEVLEPPASSLTPLATTVLPTFGVPESLPPLVPQGLAFSGNSPGLASDAFVLSRFRIDGLLEPGQIVQLRFITGNLGGECDGSRWDVSLVAVEGLLVPEPDGLALAAAGGVAAAAMGRLAGRRLRRRPEGDRGLTTAPRVRA